MCEFIYIYLYVYYYKYILRKLIRIKYNLYCSMYTRPPITTWL